MKVSEYHKYDSYGAANVSGWIKKGETELAELCLKNFGDFLEANPNVVPTKDGGYLHCQTHLLISGQWQCHRRCSGGFHGEVYDKVYDHIHGMRLKGIRKSYFAAAHPYNIAKDGVRFIKDGSQTRQGLEVRYYETQKDWYYPGRTSLCLIGTPENLSALNLNSLGEPLRIVEGALTTPRTCF